LIGIPNLPLVKDFSVSLCYILDRVFIPMPDPMKPLISILLGILALLLAGCASSTPVCPPLTGTPEYLSLLPDQLPTPTPSAGRYTAEIGGHQLLVDKIVQGALCNDYWSGTVYVACDVKVYPWTEEPLFLKNCQLNIDPNTVVYVAYHNNATYYKGCSCHTGITPEP
jgi:hypothetical protein